MALRIMSSANTGCSIKWSIAKGLVWLGYRMVLMDMAVIVYNLRLVSLYACSASVDHINNNHEAAIINRKPIFGITNIHLIASWLSLLGNRIQGCSSVKSFMDASHQDEPTMLWLISALSKSIHHATHSSPNIASFLPNSLVCILLDLQYKSYQLTSFPVNQHRQITDGMGLRVRFQARWLLRTQDGLLQAAYTYDQGVYHVISHGSHCVRIALVLWKNGCQPITFRLIALQQAACFGDLNPQDGIYHCEVDHTYEQSAAGSTSVRCQQALSRHLVLCVSSNVLDVFLPGLISRWSANDTLSTTFTRRTPLSGIMLIELPIWFRLSSTIVLLEGFTINRPFIECLISRKYVMVYDTDRLHASDMCTARHPSFAYLACENVPCLGKWTFAKRRGPLDIYKFDGYMGIAVNMWDIHQTTSLLVLGSFKDEPIIVPHARIKQQRPQHFSVPAHRIM
ncbi:hypothetical protein O0I10_006292 [Lichtheimia ornata]|uniref:Uncharacterized protein n=1 Tax=Lichtheimia ornata TaxID=688661 RepID=A0AAD7V3R2_9FUNG|nr:uncharacterized protein O0I10_006292 [Lichtheimia ornata]KAJ8658021.1 hypothetical protein O0I10_006292 [Lichtheimia ornata]